MGEDGRGEAEFSEKRLSRKVTRGKNEYGDEAVLVAEVWRYRCASLLRRNGAWLIAWSGPLTDESVQYNLFDCAGSLTTAKRVARDGARQLGYEPAWRWQEVQPGLWEMTGKCTETHTYDPEFWTDPSNTHGEVDDQNDDD